MSAYPSPTLHNGLLNTVFNPKDFTTTSKLNSTVVNGPLNINGSASCNAGLQVNGSINTTVDKYRKCFSFRSDHFTLDHSNN